MFDRLWYIVSMRCDEADRLRSRQALEPLNRSERLAMRLHQVMCKSCRAADRQLQILDDAIANLKNAESDPVPDAPGRLSKAARNRIASTLGDAEKSQENSN